MTIIKLANLLTNSGVKMPFKHWFFESHPALHHNHYLDATLQCVRATDANNKPSVVFLTPTLSPAYFLPFRAFISKSVFVLCSNLNRMACKAPERNTTQSTLRKNDTTTISTSFIRRTLNTYQGRIQDFFLGGVHH